MIYLKIQLNESLAANTTLFSEGKALSLKQKNDFRI